ncbi:MAG: transcription termination/antitermination protein NusG [Firmicutes bacterium]|nr:transcription termination/antitermination protein NusG [Bacillota bacterium]
MAKFDKNIKNEFLDSAEFYDEDVFFEDEFEEYEEFEGAEAEYNEEYPEAEYESELSDEEDDAVVDTADRVEVVEEKSGSEKARWYVVHTYSGHENKVKANIEKIVENRGMQDLIQCVEMPTEDIVEVKNGQRKVRTRKMFPGYVIVKMIITSESWYLIRNTQGVTGFVGHGSDPIPLTDEEVRHMGIEKVSFNIDVEAGDTVKVIDGPFDNFMGVVEDVNMEKQTLKVRISMFGRETPVELEFGQVEKIS